MAANPGKVQPGAPIESSWGNAMRERVQMIVPTEAEIAAQFPDAIEGSSAWTTYDQSLFFRNAAGTWFPLRTKAWSGIAGASVEYWGGGNTHAFPSTFVTREQSLQLEFHGMINAYAPNGRCEYILYFQLDSVQPNGYQMSRGWIEAGLSTVVPLQATFFGVGPGTHTVYISGYVPNGAAPISVANRQYIAWEMRHYPH